MADSNLTCNTIKLVYSIRPAIAADKAALAAFTKATFEWGDYIEERFDEWLAEPGSKVVVAEHDGVAIGVVRGVMLSETEFWLQGARVHPDHRGHDLSHLLANELFAWGKQQGAHVARVYIEDYNETSQHLVARDGYRRVSRWLFAEREHLDTDPAASGNGGKRVPGNERLRPASGAEAEPAFMAWSTSALSRAARGLYAENWKWRQLDVEALRQAAKDDRLLEGASGWVIANRHDHFLNVAWILSSPDDTYRIVRSIWDRAMETRATGLSFWVPATPEFEAALNRIGCQIQPGSVWERSLTSDQPLG